MPSRFERKLKIANTANLVILLAVCCSIATGARSEKVGSEKPKTSPSNANPSSKGSVQHSETVKPVATFLRGGVTFSNSNQAQLQAIEPNNLWFKIPSWLGGKWQFYESQTTSHTDLATGKTSNNFRPAQVQGNTVVWGWQQDKNGDIWQYEDSPHANHEQIDQFMIYYVRHENQPISSSPSTLTCSMLYTNTSVNLTTNTISKTTQDEDFVTFTPIGSDQIRRDVSAKIFDQDGKPLALTSSYGLARRTAPFQPIDSKDGKDMRALFRSYLNNHGFSDLVPDKNP